MAQNAPGRQVVGGRVSGVGVGEQLTALCPDVWP